MPNRKNPEEAEREGGKICFLRYVHCLDTCVAYDRELTPPCRLLGSLKSVEDSLRIIAQASGLYHQSIESGWHR